MTDTDNLAKTDLAGCLEAILFVASGPVTAAQLSATLTVSNSRYRKCSYLVEQSLCELWRVKFAVAFWESPIDNFGNNGVNY